MTCIFLVIFTNANAEEIIKCIDAGGNTIYTSGPQDGMKCFVEKSESEPQNQNRSLRVNLMEKCSDLIKRYDELENRKNDIYKQIAELKKQQDNFTKDCCTGTGNYASIRAEDIRNKMDNLKEQYSSLAERQSEICEVITSYKCDEIYQDMVRILQHKNRGYGR